MQGNSSQKAYIRKMTPGVHLPDNFPSLKTDRVNLVWISSADRSFIFRLFSDPQVQEFRGVPGFATTEEADLQIWTWRKMFAKGEGMRWGIFHREIQQLIGTAGLRQINHRHRSAEISYELIPGWWNRGIMTEVLKKITAYALDELGLHTISANIDPRHGASKRVLEKLGFRNEAHFRENWYHEGWWDSSIWVKNKIF